MSINNPSNSDKTDLLFLKLQDMIYEYNVSIDNTDKTSILNKEIRSLVIHLIDNTNLEKILSESDIKKLRENISVIDNNNSLLDIANFISSIFSKKINPTTERVKLTEDGVDSLFPRILNTTASFDPETGEMVDTLSFPVLPLKSDIEIAKQLLLIPLDDIYKISAQDRILLEDPNIQEIMLGLNPTYELPFPAVYPQKNLSSTNKNNLEEEMDKFQNEMYRYALSPEQRNEMEEKMIPAKDIRQKTSSDFTLEDDPSLKPVSEPEKKTPIEPSIPPSKTDEWDDWKPNWQ